MMDHPALSIARLSMVVEPDDPSTIPLFTGPALRGAFGKRLRCLSCLTSRKECSGCGLARICTYHRIFETKNNGSTPLLPGGTDAPRPFVFKLPRVVDGRLLFICTLIGRAIDHLSTVLAALEKLGHGFTTGLEYQRPRVVRFRTLGVFGRASDGCDYPLKEGESWPTNRRMVLTFGDFLKESNGQGEVGIEVISPIHIVEAGAPLTRFDLKVFLQRLCTRIEVISNFHCGGVPAVGWFDTVKEAARGVHVGWNDTRWAAAPRYSTRHRHEAPLQGFVGTVVLSGTVGPLLPVLRLGEVLGVGNSTTQGCGDYELRVTE